MAQKGELAVGNSSSEEEEEGSSEEQEQEREEGSEIESSSEEEDQPKTSQPTTKKPSSSKKPQTTPLPTRSYSSESGSDSGSESDSPVKPLASKPMEAAEPLTKSTKKPRSKPAPPTSPPAKSGAKRPVESEPLEGNRNKRKLSDVERDADEVKKSSSGDDPKKQLFQRLWSEEDEIAILKGLLEYKAKKGADPLSDLNAFLEFIKKSLHIDASKTQLSTKIRTLRRKYLKNASKENKGGGDRAFSKPHEEKTYHLSKKIWGNTSSEGNSYDAKVVNGTPKKNQNSKRASASKPVDSPKVDKPLSTPDVQELSLTEVAPRHGAASSPSVSFYRSIGDMNPEEEFYKNGSDFLSADKRKELDQKWKEQRVLEAEAFLKRAELIYEHSRAILEATRSKGR